MAHSYSLRKHPAPLSAAVFVIFHALVFCTFVSCSKETEHKLQYAESVIQEHPDSALAALQSVSQKELRTARQKGLYSLLYAKALDKNYIDTTDLSIIEPAVEYFSRHKDGDRYAEALFYKGRIYQNDGDNQTAIMHFNEALDMVSPDNHILLDLLYTWIAWSHSSSKNHIDALKYSRIAYEESLITGIEENINSNLFTLAEAEHNCSNVEVADSLLTELMKREPADSQRYLMAVVLRGCNFIEKDYPDYKKALEMFDYAYSHNAEFYPEAILEYKYAIMQSAPHRSTDFLDEAINLPENVPVLWWNSEISIFNHDYEIAVKQLQSYIRNTNVTIDKVLEQSLLRQEKIYQEAKVQNLNQRHQIDCLSQIIGLLVIMLLALAAGLIYIIMKKYHQEQIFRLEESLSAANELLSASIAAANKKLSSTNAAHNEKLSELRAEFISLYRKQFSEIESLCVPAMGTISHTLFDSMRNKLAHSLDEIAQEIIVDKDRHKELEQRINTDVDNVIQKLRSEASDVVSEEEIQMFCYIVLGFSGRTISFLMGLPEGACRVRKTRLKQKIEKTDIPDRDFFLSFF